MSASTNMDDTLGLTPQPSAITREEFLASYGEIYESSPWVADRLWLEASSGAIDTLGAMRTAMRATVETATPEQRLALVCAHPELAGRAAIAGELNQSSTREQAGAGLDQCSPLEFKAFQVLNKQYNDKFNFPFIIAVKGLARTEILTAFRNRLGNDRETELETALNEIHKIAAFRLSQRAG